jgi:hypothetical protein
MYLEMIDEVLPNVGRIYIMEAGQTAPIPFLNLNEPAPAPAPAGKEGAR